MKDRLLLHACCAPCLVAVFDDIVNNLEEYNLENKSDFDIIWYNTNIHPYTEYALRRDTLKEFLKMNNKEGIFLEEYNVFDWTKHALNFKEEGYEFRCEYCYTSRLEKVFKYAKENNYTAVTTTLLISPYQKHDVIINVCNKLSEKYGVKFIYKDFRPMFYDGQTKAKQLGLYRQKYCGCIYSEESRYNNPNPPKAVLPTGCEYINRRTVCVKKIDNKDDYMDLFLEADPSKACIGKYLNDSDVYGLQVEENIVSLAVILHIDNKTLELKNLVTKEEYRGKGYAKKLLKSLCGNYKQKYSKMLVGTAENNIPFYVKQGFDKYEKTIKNFFVNNYEEEIWDGDLQCIDMYYYSKDLKKK